MWHGSCLGKKRESLMTLARRLVFCLAILALLPWGSIEAEGLTITAPPTPPALAFGLAMRPLPPWGRIEAEVLTITAPPTLLYSGNVFYPDVSFTGPGHIIGKAFDTLDSSRAAVAYDRDGF